MIHYDTLMSLSILSLSQCFVDEIPHSPGKKLLTWLQPCNSGCSSNLPVPATLTFHLARWKNLPLRPWDALRCGINGAKTRVIDGYLANSQKFGLYLNSDCGKTSQESLPSVNSSGEKRVEVIASSASCHVKRCRYNRLPSPPTSQHPCVRQWSQSAKTYRLLLGQDPMSREVSRSPGSAKGPTRGPPQVAERRTSVCTFTGNGPAARPALRFRAEAVLLRLWPWTGDAISMVRTRFLLENVISDGDLNTGHLMSFIYLFSKIMARFWMRNSWF